MTETARKWFRINKVFCFVYSIIWYTVNLSSDTLFFLPTKWTCGRAEGECCICWMYYPHGCWHHKILHSFHLLFPTTFQHPRRRLEWFSLCVCVCVCVCFIHFNFIVFFSPSFHLISPRTNTNSSHPESLPRSVVPHFVCLHFTMSPGKATFRARLQSESRCCSFRLYNSADFACQDIYRELHALRVCGTQTYTCSRPHATNISA